MYPTKVKCKSPIGAFQDQYKQRMINEFSNEHNKDKNPNWQGADQSSAAEKLNSSASGQNRI